MPTYDTVYDASDFHPGNWGVIALGAAVMLAGVILIGFSRQYKPSKFDWTQGQRWPPHPVFAWSILLFGTAWTLLAGTSIVSDELAVHKAMAEKSYHVISGPVTDFKPRPKEGHTGWGFTVQGVHFDAPDFQADDGPIHANDYVRVSYICRPSEQDCRPLIVRMEIET